MKGDSIKEILKDLKTVFEAQGFNFYNEIAPESAPYPFVTYEVDNSFTDGEATETVILYIDGWDLFSEAGSSTLRLENLMSDVLKSLYRRRVVVSENFGFWYILDSRRWIRDPEDDIRHRRFMYQVRVFGKE